jgi:predicted metal-dependent peptidase
MGGPEHVPDDMQGHLLGDLLDAGEPDGLAYFTDLEGPTPTEAPPYPMLWVATTTKKHPWGDRVTVDPQEDM